MHRIVEKFDGQVYVESTAGQGSVFSFTLPAARWHLTPEIGDQNQ